MDPHPKLAGFLDCYPETVQQLFLHLRSFVLETVPDCHELIWDNYNALALAYSRSDKLADAFCHLALYSTYVNLGFNRATELQTGSLPLKGSGKLIRHLTVKHMDGFPDEQVRPVLLAAVEHSVVRNPDLRTMSHAPISMVMSETEKKRRPR